MPETSRSYASQPGWLMGRLVSHPILTALVVLIIGLAISYVLYAMVTRLEQNRLSDNFKLVALKHHSLLERTIHAGISPLQTLHSFYRSSDSVYRDEFRSFVEPLLAHHSEIQTLQWIPRVWPNQQTQIEQTARREGIDGYEIGSWPGLESEAAEHFDPPMYPAYVVEPHPEFSHLLGIDLASHPGLAEALNWACDQNAVAATQLITLDRSKDAEPVMFVLMPVYQCKEPHGSVSIRREHLNGFVAATYRADDMVGQTLTPQDKEQFVIFVYDMMAPDDNQLFYQSAHYTEKPAHRFDPNEDAAADGIMHTAVLNLADRLWGVRYLPTEAFLRSQATGRAVTLFAAGAAIALLLALGAIVGLRHSARTREVSEQLREAMEKLEQDVVERRKAEHALRSSETLYRSTIDAMSDIIIVVDKELKITLVNRALVDRYREMGLSTEFVGKLLTEAFPFVSDTTEQQYHRLFETGEVHTSTECYPVGGHQFTVEMQRIPVMEDGRVVRLITAARDVTERKKAEHDLRLTQFAVDKAADAMYWMGSDARFVYVNDAACRALGYTKEELLTMTVHDIDPNFPPEVWPKHWKDLEQFRSFTLESNHRTKDGRVFPVEITVNLVEYEGHEYNCAYAKDISARNQATKSEDTSICSFQNFADNNAHGIAIISPRMKLLYMNRRLKEWYPSEDITKSPICHERFNSAAPDKQCAHCPALQTLADGGTHRAVERRMVGDTLRTFKVTTSPIKDGSNQVVAIVEMVQEYTAEPDETGGERGAPENETSGEKTPTTPG